MGQNSLHFLLPHNLPQPKTCACAHTHTCTHACTHTRTHLPLAVPVSPGRLQPSLCHVPPFDLPWQQGGTCPAFCSHLHLSLCVHITPHEQFSFSPIIPSLSLKVLLTFGGGDGVGVSSMQVSQGFISRASTKWRSGCTKWKGRGTLETKLLLKIPHPEGTFETSLTHSPLQGLELGRLSTVDLAQASVLLGALHQAAPCTLPVLGLPVREATVGVQRSSFPP